MAKYDGWTFGETEALLNKIGGADVARAETSAVHSASGSGPGDTLPCRPGEVSVATFDFGEVVAGTIILELDAPVGACIDLAAAERRAADDSLDFDDQHS